MNNTDKGKKLNNFTHYYNYNSLCIFRSPFGRNDHNLIFF